VVPASGGVQAHELFGLGRALGPLTTLAAPTIVKRLEALPKNDYGKVLKIELRARSASVD
jgi:acyl-coenzyme A synthetase/AMP-(fatty) acid ligase